ncbi:hypothetical protein ACFY36_40535 [Actinoplanes sp. NPDC000266]
MAPPPVSVFGLRKTWTDPGPGIAMVQAHYACSPTGAQPDWSSAEQVVLAPGPVRTAVFELPRSVDGSTDFSLHHFFFVVGTGDRTTSPVFAEDIVAREVVFDDVAGTYTSVGFMWSAVDSPVPNYTSGAMDGLPFETPGTAPPDGDVYEFVRAQPLPHVFRGLVWGVRGTTIRYGYHLVRQGMPDPAADDERWDDNGGHGWTISL